MDSLSVCLLKTHLFSLEARAPLAHLISTTKLENSQLRIFCPYSHDYTAIRSAIQFRVFSNLLTTKSSTELPAKKFASNYLQQDRFMALCTLQITNALLNLHFPLQILQPISIKRKFCPSNITWKRDTKEGFA